ncbi:MAG TPA: hypothetical protein VFH27_04450 [Longimicrobiaceae bacterium]|nr:hypothetical protein [Longimicrobiaceae bacterium]
MRSRCIQLHLAAALAAAALAGCGGRTAPPADSPVPATVGAGSTTTTAASDPAATADSIRRATMLRAPRRLTFGWELDEAGARFHGRGVARVGPPDRIRLDLFGPRGETYLAAALVDETPRVPAALEGRVPMPSPALLWGVLGVVRPPAAARLVSASATQLRYDAGEQGTLEYRLENGTLRTVRRLVRGGLAESIDLTRAADGAVQRASYRDWAAYRTLTLTLESAADVEPFPEDTWTPPGTER